MDCFKFVFLEKSMDSWISEGLNSVLASGNPTGGLIEKHVNFDVKIFLQKSILYMYLTSITSILLVMWPQRPAPCLS